MTDPRSGKIYQISFPEWIEFCAEQGIDPIGNCELGFDLGGGQSYLVACYDRPIDEKEK